MVTKGISELKSVSRLKISQQVDPDLSWDWHPATIGDTFLDHFFVFITVATHLTKLACHRVEFTWDDKHKAFQLLKTAVVTSLVLAYPANDGRYIQNTYASNFQMGAVGDP